MFKLTVDFLAKRVIAGQVDINSIGHGFNLHNLVAARVEELKKEK